MDSLKKALISGSLWMVLLRVASKFGLLAFSIIVARNLSQIEFGISMTLILLAGLLNMFTFGIESSMIQQREDPSEYELNVAWTIDRLFLKTSLALLLLVLASPIACLFDIVDYITEVRLLALIPFVQVFENNALVILMRKLNFKSRFILEFPQLVFIVLSIPLLSHFQDIGIVPWIFICSSFCRSLLSYVVVKRIPKYAFDSNIFMNQWTFGKWIVFKSILLNIKERMEAMALGILLGPLRLGLFQATNQLSSKLISEVYLTGNKVLFPVLSRGHQDGRNIDRLLSFVHFMTGLSLIPSIVIIPMLVNWTVDKLYGTEFVLDSNIVTIILVVGLVRLLNGMSYSFFRSKGVPKYELFLSLVQFIVFVLLLGIAYFFVDVTILSIVVSALISEILAYMYNIYLMSKLKMPFKDFVIRLVLGVVIASPLLLINLL